MVGLRFRLRHALRGFELDVGLEVGPGETIALVGPSGAGKTSVLRAIAGLYRPEDGIVEMDGKRWLDTESGVDLAPERRSVGLVFQDYALFPHLTVLENVAFGGRERAGRLVETFGLSTLAQSRPRELSGGERQRVALARALARDPAVLLLDEPLGALDPATRAGVRADLRAHLRTTGLPTLVVTHDYADAVALADRVGVLVSGRIVQLGAPQELSAAPVDPFVAAFTGDNFLRGTARPAGGGLTEVVLHDGTRIYSTDEGEGEVGVVVHPWEVAVARVAPVDSMQNHLAGRIESIVPLGNRVRIRVGSITAEVTVASIERLALTVGEKAVASFKATGTRLVSGGA
jgi:ABC-type sulfate/molybdate transport systems ATPase subunit